MLIWLAAATVVFSAALVQGIAGFAFGILSMACLTLLWDVVSANVIVTLVALWANLQGLWSVRHSVRWPHVAPLVVGLLIGTPLGTFILVSDRMADVLRYILALACLLVALQAWLQSEPRPGRIPRVTGLLMGIASGFFSAVVSAAGPPILYYVYRQSWPREELKATTLTAFGIVATFKVVLFVLHDVSFGSSARLFTAERCLWALALLPTAFLGTAVGVRLFSRVNAAALRRIVCVLLLVMAATLIATAVSRA